MAFNTGDMTVVGLDGTWTVTVNYSTALGTLTFPTRQTILADGFERSREGDPRPEENEVDFGTAKFRVEDDHGVYAEGFWHKIINAAIKPEFIISLDGVEWFQGELVLDDTQWDEPYRVNNSAWKRVISIALVRPFAKLKDVEVPDLVTEVLLHEVVTNYSQTYRISKCVNLRAFFDSFLVCAFGQDYDIDDVTMPNATNQDLWLMYDVSTPVTYSYIFLPTEQDDNGTAKLVNYFGGNNSGGSDYPKLEDTFKNAYELFFVACFNFGLVPHMVYDLATDHQQLIFTLRQRSNAVVATFPKESLKSSGQLSTEYFVRAVRASHLNNDAAGYWISDQLEKQVSPPPDFLPLPIATYPIPDGQSFDIDLQILWDTSPVPQNTTDKSQYLIYDSGSVSHELIYAECLPPSAGGYRIGTLSYALCLYFFEFFREYSRRIYRQTYKGIKATSGGVSSINNVRTGNLMSIDGATYTMIDTNQSASEHQTTLKLLEIK